MAAAPELHFSRSGQEKHLFQELMMLSAHRNALHHPGRVILGRVTQKLKPGALA